MLHYEFTGETCEYNNRILNRVRYLNDRHQIIGGWIEGEHNLKGDARVYGDAKVYDNARIYNYAVVSGDAVVSGNAVVTGNVVVGGDARIGGDAEVSDNARVYDNAGVSGDAKVSGNAVVFGNALIYDNAIVSGDAKVYGNARVFGNAVVFGNARVSGSNARVYGNAEVSGNAEVGGNARIHKHQYIKFGLVKKNLDDDLILNIFAQCGLAAFEDYVICYKSVRNNLTSDFDSKFQYEIGKIAKEKNPELSSDISCAAGLHFSYLTYWKKYGTFLECKVLLKDIIAIQEGKIRAKKCEVIRRFDIY